MKPAGQLILLIEDCITSRMLYEQCLIEAGYRVVGASDGAEGVAKANQYRPDLIITDIDMPIMDGLEATRRLRRDPRTNMTPIVVLSGTSLPRSAQRAAEAGCDAFIAKPCAPGKLLDVMREQLGGDVTAELRRTGTR